MSSDKMSELSVPENVTWPNKLLKVFSLEWAKSSYFKVNTFMLLSSISLQQTMTQLLFESFNEKRSKFVRRINIKNFIVSKIILSMIY